MRTINENLRDRLVAQAEEAEVQGLTKVAEQLTSQIEKSDVRSSEEFYSYAESDLNSDIESTLWTAAIRVADFHNQSIDANDVEKSVKALAEDFIRDLRNKIGIQDGVGAYEPTLPGEEKEHISIELKEDE